MEGLNHPWDRAAARGDGQWGCPADLALPLKWRADKGKVPYGD
jgi:hypothetical protein